MSENGRQHEGLTEYLLDWLGEAERERFELHLAGCASCSAEVSELDAVTTLVARAVPRYDVPPGLEARAYAAIEGAASPPPARGRTRLRVGLAVAAAAMLTAAVAGGTWLAASRDGAGVELQAVLAPPEGGSERASVRVTKAGIGRVVVLRTDDLPILPRGDYYELWFVGPGDSRARPNRISAGTFHPDEAGRSDASFTAAVDPALYPALSVTAEPGDGNPARTGPEVLRSKG